MTIPKVAAYTLPSERDLPANRVPWRIDPSSAALLVHDLQDYFLDFFEKDSSLVRRLLSNVVKLREACKRVGIPVVYTAQPPVQTAQQRGLLNDMWGPGITAFADAHGIAHEVAPEPNDQVFTKWRYSAFAKTPLHSWLRQSKRSQLLICGVYTHIGCQATACDAFMSDVQAFLIADASADFSRQHHDQALDYVAGCCGSVLSLAQVLETLQSAPATGQSTKSQLVLARLRQQVSDLLGLGGHAIDAHDNLLELGLDSVRLMALIENINAQGAEVDFVELAERPTLAAWSELVSLK